MPSTLSSENGHARIPTVHSCAISTTLRRFCGSDGSISRHRLARCRRMPPAVPRPEAVLHLPPLSFVHVSGSLRLAFLSLITIMNPSHFFVVMAGNERWLASSIPSTSRPRVSMDPQDANIRAGAARLDHNCAECRRCVCLNNQLTRRTLMLHAAG